MKIALGFMSLLLLSACESSNDTVLNHNQMKFLQGLDGPPYGNLPVLTQSEWPNENVCKRIQFHQYCPSTRTLTGFANGGLWWEFALPGDNKVNRIDGIALNEGYAATIAATTTMAFGYPTYEISSFSRDGQFLATMDVLKSEEELTNPNISGLADGIELTGFQANSQGQIFMPHINIQGEPLRVNTTRSFNPFGRLGVDLCIIGNAYALANDSDQSAPDNWNHIGTVVVGMTNIEGYLLNNGARGEPYYTSIRFYPELFISNPHELQFQSYSTIQCIYELNSENGKILRIQNTATLQE